LKKKEVQVTNSKRKRTWLDRKKRFRKKREHTAPSQIWEGVNDDGQAQVAHISVIQEPDEEADTGVAQAQVADGLSFTQMLTGPLTDDAFSQFW
ncbi:unnamed protein product, partial [Urochloa humidicola]